MDQKPEQQPIVATESEAISPEAEDKLIDELALALAAVARQLFAAEKECGVSKNMKNENENISNGG